MIDYTINSVNSSDHWIHFNIAGKNVLDLGCGRWYTTDFHESSTIFFAKKANLVVGVDCSQDEINFYEEKTNQTAAFFLDEFPFIGNFVLEQFRTIN